MIDSREHAYEVGRLREDQIDPAFCLVAPFATSLSIEDWRRFCHEAARERIFAATNAGGYIRGLGIGHVATHPRHGHILDLWFLCALSVADESGVASAMVEHLRAVAGAEACDGIRVQTFGQADLGRYLDEQESARPGQEIPMIVEQAPSFPGPWHR